MDLRSIVHAENSTDARKVPESPSRETPRPPSTLYQSGGSGDTFYKNRTPNGQSQHAYHPANPPPIRTTSYHDQTLGSGSPGGLTKQNSYPVARNIEQNGHYMSFTDKGSASSTQGQYSFSTPLTHTPTGSSPGSSGAYSALQRPTSSHSGTPSSAHHHIPSLVQRSPQASHNHVRLPPQSQSSQYQSSHPHTPLGPPSARPTYNVIHDSPGPQIRQRTLSSGSQGHQYPLEALPPSTRHLPSEHLLHAEPRPRDQSVSISPKTRIDTLPAAQRFNATRHEDHDSYKHTSPVDVRRPSYSQIDTPEPEIKPLARRSTSFAIEGLLNEAPTNDRTSQPAVTHTRSMSNDRQPSITNSQLHKAVVSPSISTPIPTETQTANLASPLASMTRQSLDTSQQTKSIEGVHGIAQSRAVNVGHQDGNVQKHQLNDVSMTDDSSSTISTLKAEPARKKPRLEERSSSQQSPLPVERQKTEPKTASPMQKKTLRKRIIPRFAQSVRAVALSANGNSKLPNKGLFSGAQPNAASSPPSAKDTTSEPNGKLGASSETRLNGTHIPTAQPERKTGPLGAWEPSILDVEPVEDITKVISDWLFAEVVLKQEIGVGPAGGSSATGAVLEIEAKIGRFIDQNTNDRLRLPVATECVISATDPNLRINFESSMTEAQHRTMNGFLNKTLQDSMGRKAPAGAEGPPKKRIPLVYRHTYESDRFFELSQQGLLALPRLVTDNIDPRNKRKTTVRITNDQKTGKEIAKIVKARLADINVYSPQTLFDYRISVNVEMNFDGNMTDLVEPDRARGRKPDRNKDRLSYSHLAYRVDLTQVTPTEGSTKEHELEVEVSSEEIRRQGLLAMNGQDHEYDKLVKGFLDNVRVLARHCKQ